MINCPSKLASSNFKVGTRHQYFRYFGLGFHPAPGGGRSKSRFLSRPGMTCKTMKSSCRRRCPGLARAVATAFLLAAGFTGAVFSSQRVRGRPVPTAPSILWGCEGMRTLRAGRFCSRNAGDCTCARWRHTHTWETLVNKTMTDWHVLVQCPVCLDDGTKDIAASAMRSSIFRRQWNECRYEHANMYMQHIAKLCAQYLDTMVCWHHVIFCTMPLQVFSVEK